MKVRVFKFGGSSFAKLKSYHDVASYLSSRLQKDSDKIVVVVSAMYGATENLKDKGYSLNKKISPEALDSLLAMGEMTSTCLLKIALESINIKNTHLNGFQVGIKSDFNYTRGKIAHIDSNPILNALQHNDIVIVAGGQAVNIANRLVMLGRNSSDLTAVALAGVLGLPECKIFSDVAGVYSADPYLIKNALLLDKIPYDNIIEMSKSGAKVLHHKAVELAKKHNINIICRLTANPEKKGTIISFDKQIPYCNTITINDKIVTLKFENSITRDKAQWILESKNITNIVYNSEDAFYLVNSDKVFDCFDCIKSQNIPCKKQEDKCLVTEISGAGEIKRSLLHKSKAFALTQQLHLPT